MSIEVRNIIRILKLQFVKKHKPISGDASQGFVEETNTKSYITVSDFVLEGKWKNIGSTTYGQVQSGAIVAFDGTHCNFVSPQDTYAFYKDGKNWKLDCTTLLGDTLTFTVKTIDKDTIDIKFGSGFWK